jgi:hypothetical protein
VNECGGWIGVCVCMCVEGGNVRACVCVGGREVVCGRGSLAHPHGKVCAESIAKLRLTCGWQLGGGGVLTYGSQTAGPRGEGARYARVCKTHDNYTVATETRRSQGPCI